MDGRSSAHCSFIRPCGLPVVGEGRRWIRVQVVPFVDYLGEESTRKLQLPYGHSIFVQCENLSGSRDSFRIDLKESF